jgi:hypothetical protein
VDIGEGGYVYFYGGLKRAFLQSLPYLGLLPLMIAGVRGYSPKASAYSLFLSVSAFWIAPFALTEWHGGLSFNMRYFVPLLPFVSVASAAAIQELERALAPDTDRVFQSAKRVGCYTAIAAALAFILVAARPAVGYALALYIPLLLASALAAASLVFLRRPPARCRPAAATAFLLAVSSVVWAGASAIVHDVNMTWKLRAEVADVNSLTALLEDQIVVVTNIPEYFRAQFLREGSIVATVSARRPFDVVALAEHYLSQGRPVYIHHEDTPVPEVLEWLSQYETRFVDLGSIRLAVARPE